MNRRILLCGLLLIAGSQFAFASPAQVLIVAGPSKHPPGTHEVAAGARLMAHCLGSMTNLPGVTAEVFSEWPASPAIREAASTVVFIGDFFPPNRLPNPEQTLAELGEMMARGKGIACIHYATGLAGGDVTPEGDHPLLQWTGGYFANRSCSHHQSIARVFPAATITPAAPDHPVARGWQEFTLHDEPYINNYFGPGNRLAPNVTALATSLLPPEEPKPEIVAWCAERAGGGRGFSIVMPHFYRNWLDEDLRRFILNGIVWTAQLEVPAEGVQTAQPDLALFEPDALEPAPPKAKPAPAAP
jgi:type 1 glutamine amidotransferase